MKIPTAIILSSLLILASCSKREVCIDYVISGDYDKVKYELDNGLDPNTQGKWGSSLLKIATGYKDIRIIKLLISRGADVNLRDENGRNALMTASISGNPEAVRLLIESGADVNAKDRFKQTALMHATRPKHNTEVMKLLLDSGIGINEKDCFGDTALGWAIKEKNLEAVKYLVERGIDIHAKNNSGFGPLEMAKDYDNDDRKDIVAYLEVLLASGAEKTEGVGKD